MIAINNNYIPLPLPIEIMVTRMSGSCSEIVEPGGSTRVEPNGCGSTVRETNFVGRVISYLYAIYKETGSDTILLTPEIIWNLAGDYEHLHTHTSWLGKFLQYSKIVFLVEQVEGTRNYKLTRPGGWKDDDIQWTTREK